MNLIWFLLSPRLIYLTQKSPLQTDFRMKPSQRRQLWPFDFYIQIVFVDLHWNILQLLFELPKKFGKFFHGSDINGRIQNWKTFRSSYFSQQYWKNTNRSKKRLTENVFKSANSPLGFFTPTLCRFNIFSQFFLKLRRCIELKNLTYSLFI